jgi:hypothetical protein
VRSTTYAAKPVSAPESGRSRRIDSGRRSGHRGHHRQSNRRRTRGHLLSGGLRERLERLQDHRLDRARQRQGHVRDRRRRIRRFGSDSIASLAATIWERRRRLPLFLSHAWTWMAYTHASPCVQQATAHQAASHPSNHHPRPRGHEQRPSRQIEGSPGSQSKQARWAHDANAVSQPSSSNGRPQPWRE